MSLHIFRWFSLSFREITYAKNVREDPRFLLFFLQQRVAKKAARKRDVSRKRRENQRKKYRETFSYQFVARMPKIRQI